VGRISLGAPGGWTWDRDVGLESRSVSRCWINGDPLWVASSITIKAPLTQNNQTNQLPNIKALLKAHTSLPQPLSTSLEHLNFHTMCQVKI